MSKPKLNKRVLIIICPLIVVTALIIAVILINPNSAFGNPVQGENRTDEQMPQDSEKVESPFKGLTAEDVKSISIYSMNKEIVYTVSDEECAEIVGLLSQIEIGEEDKTQYDGIYYPAYRLEKNDGTIIDFSMGGPLVFNGKQYEVVEGKDAMYRIDVITREYFSKYAVLPLNPNYGANLLKDLSVDRVKSISLYSQNETKEIIYTFTDAECEKIVRLLTEIRLGERDYNEYADSFDCQFCLEKTDGTIIEFGANTYFWIEGQRYKVQGGEDALNELREIHTEYYKEY